MPNKTSVTKLDIYKIENGKFEDSDLQNFDINPQLYLMQMENKKHIKPALHDVETIPQGAVPKQAEVQADPREEVYDNFVEDMRSQDQAIRQNQVTDKSQEDEEASKFIEEHTSAAIKSPPRFDKFISDSHKRHLVLDPRARDKSQHHSHRHRPSYQSDEARRLRHERKKLERLLAYQHKPTTVVKEFVINSPEKIAEAIAEDENEVVLEKKLPPPISQIKSKDYDPSKFKSSFASKPPMFSQYSQKDGSQSELEKKREILFKFHILRKANPGATLNEYSELSDLPSMERDYDHQVRKLHLDSTVDSYKRYLINGFMVTEYVFKKWFKLDMDGYTQNQLTSMSSYDKLLIELGEKSYLSNAKQFPVEARLLFAIVGNAVMFVVSKKVFGKLASSLNSHSAQSAAPAVPTASETAIPKPKRMKGPTADGLDDLLSSTKTTS